MKSNVHLFKKKIDKNIPLVAVTAYDAVTAKIATAAGINILLVGDSVGMTSLGFDSTIPVQIEDIVRHSAATRRGAPDAFIIADMPFLTYQTSSEDAIRNAGLLIQKGNVDAVKLEGGIEIAPTIKKLIECGIPVLGHIGLLPQHVLVKGGYFLRGKTEEDTQLLIQDALEIQKAGVFATVIEGVMPLASKKITETLSIPTIGIGAGSDCDGQIQVFHDLIGLSDYLPKHAIQCANVKDIMIQALLQYRQKTESGIFPTSLAK